MTKKIENTDALSSSDRFQMAMQYHQTGNFAQAEVLYRQILQQEPNHPDALHFLGVLAYQVGQNQAAVALISRAINVYPTSSAMYCNLGLTLQAEGKLDDAVASYQKAIVLQPDYADAFYNLANALQAQGKLEQAIDQYRQTLVHKPDFAAASNNLGNVFKQQNNLEAAISHYLAAIASQPNYAEAYFNLGLSQQALGKYSPAFESYQKALAILPDYSDAQSALGVLLLTLGQFKQGWQLYEARYDARTKNNNTFAPNVPFPQWQGQSLVGKSLIVWTEQGLGDEIQFSRYASVLKYQGAKQITWVCKKPLKILLKTLKAIDDVVTTEEISLIAPHDYWTFALSIPLHCQTTLETIPATIPYLYAKPGLVADIARELSSIPQFKVGLCWKGNPGHKNDINRSPGITAFKPLFDMFGVKFFNLQPDTREEFIQNAGKNAVDRWHEIDKNSFEEAAALIENLDLVISCDTSIAHLAGALGKPVWIVLPFTADWRWLREREDSPWYPNSRLFRQTTVGDWHEVFQRIEQQLAQQIAEKTTKHD